MKKISLLFITVLVLCACSSHKKIAEESLNVVELGYGICDVRIINDTPLNDSPTGVHKTSTDFKILETTKEIPCTENQRFGVCYVVASEEDKEVPINIVWTFPETIKNEDGRSFSQTGYIQNVTTNRDNHITYALGEKYLEVKGNWKVEMFHNGHKLYERKFRLN